MAVTLRYVSSPAKLRLQTYYSAASSGFATYAPWPGDGTQPPGTAWMQSIDLQESAYNVVDIGATTWLASWIAASSADPLLSQVAINASIFPPPNSQPGTVIPPT